MDLYIMYHVIDVLPWILPDSIMSRTNTSHQDPKTSSMFRRANAIGIRSLVKLVYTETAGRRKDAGPFIYRTGARIVLT